VRCEAALKRRTLHRLAGLALLSIAARPAAAAGIPAAYDPVSLHPSGMPAYAEFDLTEVLQRARIEGKALYLYLGAADCPYCRRYEAFLARHADALVAQFATRYIVVDLRSTLAVDASALHLRVGARRWNYTEFQRAIGDSRQRALVYPTVWLLGPDLKPLMQMPGGTGTFETVSEQLEILQRLR